MRRVLRFLAALALIALLAIAALVATLWHQHNSDVMLPAPTGPFAVGRTIDVWRDPARELVVWMWYPATRTSGAKPAQYLPPDWRSALERRSSKVLSLISRDAARIHPHSFVDAPVSAEQGAYPVVILRAGLGALTTNYTTLAEDLASHGYVVVGFDAPDLTSTVVFPDGRVIDRPPENNPETVSGDARYRLVDRLLAAWTDHTRFVVNRLAELNGSRESRFYGRLNLQALGVAGHSLGGATAAEFCYEDSRCRAGIDIDGAPFGKVVREGLHQPFLFLFSDHTRDRDPDATLIGANFRSLFEHTPAADRPQVTIRGANHFSFTDQVVTRPEAFVKLFQLLSGLQLDARRGLAITGDCATRFFDAHLKGAPVSRPFECGS